MSTDGVTRAEFDALLKELQSVRAKLADLEKRLPQDEELNEEVLEVIAAAVAAYLGKRATIRVIRRVNERDTWRLQGRAALQGSHAMPRTRAIRN